MMASVAALEARLARLSVCAADEHTPKDAYQYLYVIGGNSMETAIFWTGWSAMTLLGGSGRHCRV